MLNIKITTPKGLKETVLKFEKRCRENPAMMEAAGKAASFVLRRHFARLNTKPNKRGFRKSGYWARIETATNFDSSSKDSATVIVSDDTFNAKVNGAIIKPTNAKALAIPLSNEAYGKRPSQWNNPVPLKLIPRKGKPSILATTGADGSLNPQYVLLRRTRVPADKDALPTDRVFFESVFGQLESNLDL